MKRVITILVFGLPGVLVAQQHVSLASATPVPTVYLMNGSRLAEIKEQYRQGDINTLQAVNSLVSRADALLDKAPLSVMDKAKTPPGGNKHDYMSQAPYFWYDSSKPQGLPYLRRDGERNPEIYTITDHRYMGDLDNACRQLALAWYFTGQEKYAAKAAALLKHWFFEEATRMNPNLNYAQAVPGVNDGRGTGIIESIALMGIADADGLLEGSSSWGQADGAALRQWYAQYLDWMLTSKNGRDEHAARNNHGTWYLAQAADFALFSGDTARARALTEEGRKGIETQIDGEGKMALELARTNGLGYCTYNLQAWFGLATLGERVGVDLWDYHNRKGAGIRTALDWLSPYALGKKKWDYQQISSYNTGEIYSLLLQASRKYKDPRYAEYAGALDKGSDQLITTLLYARDQKGNKKA